MVEMPVATAGERSLELKGGLSPLFEKGPGVEVPEDFDQRHHHSGPTGLMTGADPGAVGDATS